MRKSNTPDSRSGRKQQQTRQGARASAEGSKQQQKAGAGSRQPERPQPQSLGHGGEALAALAVNIHKTSRFKTKLVLALLAALTFSLAWNAVQNWTQPEPKLLGMTEDGRVQDLPLLDEPLDNRQVLIDWTRRHIPKMYDFNYANYRGELNKLLEFMKPNTLDSFRSMLDESGILDRVTDDFLILQGRITDEPLVQDEVVAAGTRVWVVEIPMTLIYDSGDEEDGQREQISQDILFRAWVARANPMEFPGGLMLAKFEVSGRD